MANTYKLTLDTLLDAARTTVAAVASMLLARALRLPEYYWAPISAIVIIQSTIDPKTLAWQRFAGTAVGAALGAFIMTFFPPAHWYTRSQFSYAECSARFSDCAALTASRRLR
jgi:uncharacterized membrane protein YgaE (UPF0421/DUF939 family)